MARVVLIIFAVVFAGLMETGSTLPISAQNDDSLSFPASAVVRGENIRVRTEPAAETADIAILQRGDAVTLTGEAVAADGLMFLPVEIVATGESGWVRDLFIAPDSIMPLGVPAVTAVATAPAVAADAVNMPAPTPERTRRARRELAIDYLQPGERSGAYAGFAVQFTNNTDAEILNPQTEVIVELGGQEWNCQGYGDPITGAPLTGVLDVLGRPLALPAGQEMVVTIYCRIPEAPMDTAQLRLR